MRRLLPVLVTALALALPSSAAAACADADLFPTAANVDRLAAASFCLHNEERAREGLPALRWSDQLAISASAHSLDMVERLFFEHENPDGESPRDRIEATGYGPDWSGENIAWGAGDGYATPGRTMAGWMKSAGHRENILREQFEHVGIGVAYGAPEVLGPDFGSAAATYTANFGSRSTPDDASIGDPPGPELSGTESKNPVTQGSDPGSDDSAERTAKRKKKLKRCLKRAKKNRAKRKRCKRRYR